MGRGRIVLRGQKKNLTKIAIGNSKARSLSPRRKRRNVSKKITINSNIKKRKKK